VPDARLSSDRRPTTCAATGSRRVFAAVPQRPNRQQRQQGFGPPQLRFRGFQREPGSGSGMLRGHPGSEARRSRQVPVETLSGLDWELFREAVSVRASPSPPAGLVPRRPNAK
jgi:hypothetical protein